MNDLVVSSHDSFRQVHDGLHHVQDVVPLAAGDVVSIEAVPGRIFDMLAKAQIKPRVRHRCQDSPAPSR